MPLVSVKTQSEVRHAVINYIQMMAFEGVNKRFEVLVELSENEIC